MEIKQEIKIHNKFEISVCDAKTGEEKQKAYAYNVVLNNFFKMRLRQLDGDGYNQAGFGNTMSYISVGTGSGTPAITDDTLFTALVHREATLVEEHYEYPTSYITRQIKINADEFNGQTFTEVGMSAFYRYGMWSTNAYMLCTHAMIQDAEGNQIAITKTDTDVVYINAMFYCTYTRSGFGTNGIFPVASNNMIIKYLLKGDYDLYVRTSRFAVENATEVTNSYTHYKEYSFRDTVTGDYANMTLNMPTMTVLDSEFNNHVVKNIVIDGVGGFQFPDASVFPDYSIDRLVLGEGDGETTEFNIKCPLIKSGTVKIYVADRELDSSEYDIDYESNCVNVRENYYTAGMKMDGVHAKFGDAASKAPDTSYLYRDPLYWGLYPLTCLYPYYCTVSESNPIWIDLGSAKPCNILKMDNRKLSDTNLSRLKIQYSDDNENWTDVTYTVSQEAYRTNLYYYTFTFDMTTARYWRMYVQGTTWSYYFYYNSYSSSYDGPGTRDGVSSSKASFFLGKTVPGLTLHTAPADGETVEASYKIDIPFKTENNLMRLTCSVVLQRG